MSCTENTDFMFPMEADVYHPIVEQSAYGSVKKQWVFDRAVACSFSSVGAAGKEEVRPNVNITQDVLLIGRIKKDVRISSSNSNNSITNIVITNLRDKSCNPIYVETAGPRAGKSTIFEIASQEPYAGPFGGVEYYNIVLRRSENQAVDL
jgi:hypothetical protein